jgi:glycine cleavage system H protein
VVEANGALESDPALVNRDPYAAGWMIKLKVQDASQLTGLLDATAYEKHIGSK